MLVVLVVVDQTSSTSSTQTAEAVYDRPVTRVTSVSFFSGLIYFHEKALSLVWDRGYSRDKLVVVLPLGLSRS